MATYSLFSLQAVMFVTVFTSFVSVTCTNNEHILKDRSEKDMTLCNGTNSAMCNSTWIDVTNYDTSECYVDATELHCPSMIPTAIPDVKSVYLIEIQPYYWTKSCLFCDKSWARITFLSIFEDSQWLTLPNYTFIGLDNLTHLWIENHEEFSLDIHSFYGLTNVHTLDLYKCSRTRFDDVIYALQDNDVLPNLQHISFEKMSEYFDDFPQVLLDSYSLKVLSSKKLVSLNLSATRLKGQLHSNIPLCDTLKVINISLSIVYLTFSDPFICQSLLTLDISGAMTSRVRYISQDVIFRDTESSFMTFFRRPTASKLLVFKNVYASNIAKFSRSKYHIYIYNTTIIDDVPGGFSLISLELNGNRIKHLDLAFRTKDMKLESLFLAYNDMEYLSSKTLKTSGNKLRILDISHNMLFQMNKSEFKLLFQSTELLKELNLSHNKLVNIPTDTFINIRKIENLDLSNNKLSYLEFKTKTLKNLNMLNLQGNSIQFLECDIINTLQHISDQLKFAKGKLLQVNMNKNPLSCDCKTLPFMNELIINPIFQTSDPTSGYACSIDGNDMKPINRETMTYVQETCNMNKQRRLRIIILSISISLCFILLAIFACVAKRKYTKYTHARQYMECCQCIENDLMGFRFLVFLSFCSEDGEFVTNNALPMLNAELTRLTKTDQQLVCTGSDLLPGQPIRDQITDFMDQSAVFVAVISTEYCCSYWCKEEISQARIENKPVMLLFKEKVPESQMSLDIKNFFNNNIRTKWILNADGEYELESGWNNVCSSIIQFLNKARTNRNESETIV